MEGLQEAPDVSGALRLTVGLVTLNEESTISESLGALLNEVDRIGAKAETIVVAGGRDRTIEIVRTDLNGRERARLIVDDEPKGKPAALNRIFSLALGDIVLLSDGDVVVNPEAVRRVLAAFGDSRVGCASGRVVGGKGNDSRVMKASSLINDIMHLSRNEQYRSTGTLDLASGYLIAVRKSLVDEIPTGINSDDGYISRLALQKGYRIAYVDDALVSVNFPSTVSDFVKQKMRTRFGHMQLDDLFGKERGRTIVKEARDFMKHLRAARRGGAYGIETPVVALCLVSFCWLCALSRRTIPSLYKSPVWQPVRSTK